MSLSNVTCFWKKFNATQRQIKKDHLIAYLQNASNLEGPLYRGCPYRKPDFCKVNTFTNRSCRKLRYVSVSITILVVVLLLAIQMNSKLTKN